MRKRSLCLLLALAVFWFLTACGGKKPKMWIGPAQLTQAEQDMVDLPGAKNQMLLDFRVDETIQSLCISVYELVDGQWDPFIGGGRGNGWAFEAPEGRMALDFDHLGEGVRVALAHQDGQYSGSTAMEYIRDPDPEGTHRATSLLNQQQEIRYEEEVPLAIQIVTTRNEIRSFDTSCFYQPEEYAKYGYEHIYAVTICFSQQPVSG